jgi:hypothetical protein
MGGFACFVIHVMFERPYLAKRHEYPKHPDGGRPGSLERSAIGNRSDDFAVGFFWPGGVQIPAPKLASNERREYVDSTKRERLSLRLWYRLNNNPGGRTRPLANAKQTDRGLDLSSSR